MDKMMDDLVIDSLINIIKAMDELLQKTESKITRRSSNFMVINFEIYLITSNFWYKLLLLL